MPRVRAYPGPYMTRAATTHAADGPGPYMPRARHRPGPYMPRAATTSPRSATAALPPTARDPTCPESATTRDPTCPERPPTPRHACRARARSPHGASRRGNPPALGGGSHGNPPASPETAATRVRSCCRAGLGATAMSSGTEAAAPGETARPKRRQATPGPNHPAQLARNPQAEHTGATPQTRPVSTKFQNCALKDGMPIRAPGVVPRRPIAPKT